MAAINETIKSIESSDKAYKKESSDRDRLRFRIDIAVASGVLLYTFLTAGLLIFAASQLKAAWSQVSDSHKQVANALESEHRQLRAYVRMADIRLVKGVGEYYDVVPEWSNVGNYPTRQMRATVNFVMFPTALPDDITNGDIVAGSVPISLGPQTKSGATYLSIGRTCIDQFNKRDGLNQFMIWGHARYKDIFSENDPTAEEHVTNFCWDVSNIAFSSDGKSAQISYGLCHEGNCTDTECPKYSQEKIILQLAACRFEPPAKE